MAALLNRARMTTATTGTGTVTLGSASSGYATFAEAGAVNATVYSYCIEDGADFEIGIGTYTSSGTTFSRDTVTVSKISGTAGTSKINLSGSATIFITARSADLLIAEHIGATVQAYDADLTTWAGVTPGTGVATALAVAVGSAGAFVTFNGALGTPTSGTLTNATGLPVAGITASTSTALGVGSVELGHASDTSLARSAAGRLSVEGKNALLLGQTDVLTSGYAATPYSAGTKSTGTFTPDEANGNFQYATSGGAHTLAPPTNSCTLIILYANGASAGTVTTSGFTKVTGDSFTTTNGHEFMLYITKHNNGVGFSHLHVTALQ